jgi:hypothetical protein
MKGSGMPWPGDEGEQRWGQAWKAIKKVRLLSYTLFWCLFQVYIMLKNKKFLLYIWATYITSLIFSTWST